MQGKHGTRLVALCASILAVSFGAVTPIASAATYSNAGHFYSFAYPDAWSLDSNPNVDVLVAGVSEGGFAPSILGQHEQELTAQNGPIWLLHYVQASFNGLKGQTAVSEVQEPRTFTTNSGRLAGDVVFERSSNGVQLRERQVFFVSESHHLAFIVTLSDKASTFSNHNAAWSAAVDSFAVSGETDFGGVLQIILIVVVVLVVVAALVFIVNRRRGPPEPAAPGSGRPNA